MLPIFGTDDVVSNISLWEGFLDWLVGVVAIPTKGVLVEFDNRNSFNEVSEYSGSTVLPVCKEVFISENGMLGFLVVCVSKLSGWGK